MKFGVRYKHSKIDFRIGYPESRAGLLANLAIARMRIRSKELHECDWYSTFSEVQDTSSVYHEPDI